ncbi:MAG: hypothetical protein E7241_00100 [Lachnospiraceae bacterium]|nr:hypothetical protein [Lachnospiraceae bacterium]
MLNDSANLAFTAENTSYIGIGGCGCNIVDGLLTKMPAEGQSNNYYILDDSEIMESCDHDDRASKTDRNTLLTAEDICNWIQENIQTKTVVLLCGLGRIKTGWYVYNFAEQAKKLGKMVAVVCVMPFKFESIKWQENARYTWAVLQSDIDVDLAMSFNNDLLHEMKWKGKASESLSYAPVVIGGAFSSVHNRAEEGKLSFPERYIIGLERPEGYKESDEYRIEDPNHPEVDFKLYKVGTAKQSGSRTLDYLRVDNVRNLDDAI